MISHITFPWAPKRPGRRAILVALAALLLIRVILMIWLPLTDSTEARYAEIARKMVETGDWITPQFDYGVPFWGKPPLHSWVAALGMALFGVGAFGARLFILAAALGVLALLFGWAKRDHGSTVAMAATAICGSGVMFFGAAAFVMTDMVMCAGTTLSMVAFYRCAQGDRSIWGYLFFIGLGIGLLAKGPTAAALTALPILLWVAATARWRALAALPWAGGVLLTLLLTLPWYISAELKTPGFLRYFLIGEHIERFLVPGWSGDLYGSGHFEPKGRIWVFGAAAFLPWSLAALPLIARPRRLLNGGGQDSYLVCWMLGPLILFTPAANILPAYCLPGLPAAALLLVISWNRVFGLDNRVTALAFGAGLVSAIGAFSLVTALAVLTPDTLRLRSMKVLVDTARHHDLQITFHSFGLRSFSAEFYTAGAVRQLPNPPNLHELSANNRRDAVLSLAQNAPAAGAALGPQFQLEMTTSRFALFLEKDNKP